MTRNAWGMKRKTNTHLQITSVNGGCYASFHIDLNIYFCSGLYRESNDGYFSACHAYTHKHTHVNTKKQKMKEKERERNSVHNRERSQHL